MEERLSSSSTSAAMKSPADSKQGITLDHSLVSKETKEFKNTAAAQHDRVKALMRVLTSPDATENDLLQTVADTVVSCETGRHSPRPKSCYDNSDHEDLLPSLKKRWSNVQLGSKLLTAIDKLLSEDDNPLSDYTDSLDNPHKNGKQGENEPDVMRVSDVSSKFDDISELSATDKDTESEKEMQLHPSSLACSRDQETEGDKFRRLQMKWERLASCETTPGKDEEGEVQKGEVQNLIKANNATAAQQAFATAGQSSREKVISPNSGIRSKIPRPVTVTSPQKPFAPFDATKDLSPKQPTPGAVKDLPKPVPRRSLKDRSQDQQQVSFSLVHFLASTDVEL